MGSVPELSTLVVFSLNAQRFAIPLAAVERFTRAVELSPLPGAPSIVLGAMDVAGRIVPVLSLRRRLGQPDRPIDPDDQFVIAHCGGRAVALVVDSALDVIACRPDEIIDGGTIIAGLEHIAGVARLRDGLVLIHDLERFLSLDEARALDASLQQEALRAR